MSTTTSVRHDYDVLHVLKSTTTRLPILTAFIAIVVVIQCPSGSVASTFDCVKVPRPPLHGRVKYVKGSISARLKCSSPNEDLPLNAPGKGGILTCNPADKNTIFPVIETQKCLPYRRPQSLRMPVRFLFHSKVCDENVKLSLRKDLSNKLKALVIPLCAKFSASKCQWESIKSHCGKNYNVEKNKDASYDNQIDITTALVFPLGNRVVVSKEVQDYLDLLAEIKSSHLNKFSFHDDRDIRFKFYKAQYGSLKSSCEQYQNTTVGTDLALHKMASCRGCPNHFALDPLAKRCWRCNYGSTSNKPFSNDCVECPPENLWGNDESYKEQCNKPA